MNDASLLPPDDPLGKKLLIMGDVNVGKTTLCRQWLMRLCARGLGTRIVVLDLAAYIPPAMAQARGLAGVGGYLPPPPDCGVLDLRTHLYAPRLSSSTEAEANEKAAHNARAIDALLAQLPSPGSGRDVLFVNDVTLYLQAGYAADLLVQIGRADFTTLLVNGYWGQRLGESALSRRERTQAQRLREWFMHHGQVLDLGDGTCEAVESQRVGAGSSVLMTGTSCVNDKTPKQKNASPHHPLDKQ